jgi:bifunctional non-homologous end joining protein LigD
VLQSACRMSPGRRRLQEARRAVSLGRSATWTKAKCRAGHEVVIGGWTTDGQAFRSLIVGVYRGDNLVHVGRVGTGFGRDKVAKLLLPAGGAGAQDLAVHRQGRAKGGRPTSTGSSRNWSPKSSSPASRATAGPPGLVQGSARGQAGQGRRGRGARPPRMSNWRSRPSSRRTIGERQGLGAGRGDLQSRQAAVARRRRRQARDQVRAGRILRGGRPWMLEHIKGRPCSVIRMPGRHRRREVLPAPFGQGRLGPDRRGHGQRRPQAVPSVQHGSRAW